VTNLGSQNVPAGPGNEIRQKPEQNMIQRDLSQDIHYISRYGYVLTTHDRWVLTAMCMGLVWQKDPGRTKINSITLSLGDTNGD
jgi:hypothetical protein